MEILCVNLIDHWILCVTFLGSVLIWLRNLKPISDAVFIAKLHLLVTVWLPASPLGANDGLRTMMRWMLSSSRVVLCSGHGVRWQVIGHADPLPAKDLLNEPQ